MPLCLAYVDCVTPPGDEEKPVPKDEEHLDQRQFANAAKVYLEIGEAYRQSAQCPNAEYAALSFVRGDLCFDLSRYIS